MASDKKTNPLEDVLIKHWRKGLPDKVKDAKLRLALLKENFEYRRFFEEYRHNISTIRSLDPKFDELTPEDGDPYWELGSQYNTACMPFYQCFESFGMNIYALQSPYRRFIETLDLLDPQKKLDEISENTLRGLLQNLFHEPGIEQITVDDNDLAEGATERPFEALRGRMKPYERLIKIDLRKKKTQLLKEFGHFIDRVYAWREHSELKQDKKRLEFYSTWEPDKTRQRKETWNQLAVWKLRRQRKSFREISKQLGMTEDAAKKAFYAIYEKIQGTPYNPDKHRKDIWSVKKDELQRICDSCPDRESCMILCPDILIYVDQDLTSSAEKVLAEDSEALKDHLTHKDFL